MCDVMVSCTPLLTPMWKLHFARQTLQPSWWHLIRWPSLLDSHHRANLSRLRWILVAQSSNRDALQLLSWEGNWRRRPGMFEFLWISVAVQ